MVLGAGHVCGLPRAFADMIEHAVRNRSDRLHAILILDGRNPYITETEHMLRRAFLPVADAIGATVHSESISIRKRNSLFIVRCNGQLHAIWAACKDERQ